MMEPKVLVTYGTKYGSTAEIAQKIGEVLKQEGLQADVVDARKAGDPSAYNAVIIGSAVYIGMWRKEVTNFIKKNAGVLAQKPVWIFSSGPTGPGNPVKMMQGWIIPKGIKSTIDSIKPRDITVFHGATNESKWNLLEKMAMKNVKAPLGDFRDWNAVTAWANSIAAAMKK
jgi:menaquinone-dependent protoporphyrinogen oxidase